MNLDSDLYTTKLYCNGNFIKNVTSHVYFLGDSNIIVVRQDS